MTRVTGRAFGDAPIAKRLVYATLLPPDAAGYFTSDPADDVIDETITDANGNWELNLRPTVNTVAYYRIRVWLFDTFEVDVPVAPPGNTAVEATSITIPAPAPEPPPVTPGPYLMRGELNVPSGIATLDADGLLKLEQRPPALIPESADWFSGEGPPPPVIPGASVGDMYVDTLTGNLYQLD